MKNFDSDQDDIKVERIVGKRTQIKPVIHKTLDINMRS
jgi:hypothetical protein